MKMKRALSLLLCLTVVCSLFVVLNSAPVGAAAGEISEWAPNQAYKVGDLVTYEGKTYECVLGHTSNEGWTPAGQATLWKYVIPTPTPRPSNWVTPTPIPIPQTDEALIVGYYPEWGVYSGHNQYNVTDIPWDKLTHVNYAFATTKNGQIALFDEWAAIGIPFGETWDSPYMGNFGQLKKYKAQRGDTKILISVGGWTQSGEFHEIASTHQSRMNFADSCVQFLRQHDLDGVDIDWEYPGVPREPDLIDNINDMGNPAGPEDKHNYTLLLQTLRMILDEASYQDGKRYLLTVAASAGYDKIALTEPELFGQYLDFMNLMTYDMNGAWSSTTGHQAPLYPNPNDPSDPQLKEKYNVDWAVKEYLRLGIPANKLTMGVPYYTRGWKGVGEGPVPELPGLFAPATGGAKGIWDGGREAGCNPYYYVKSSMEGAYTKYRDPYSKVPYLYGRGEFYTYEDDISLANKCDYVINNKLGGMMFWELTGDSPSKGTFLTDVINRKFANYVPPTVKPTPTPVHTPTPTATSTATPGFASVYGSVSVDFAYSAAAAPLIKAGFKVQPMEDGFEFVTQGDGKFGMMVPSQSSYRIKISKPTYLTRYVVADNENGMVSVNEVEMWAGDMNGDGAINMTDIMGLIKYFNSAKGDGKYDEQYDLNKDGAVNMTDIMIIVRHFNKVSADYPELN